MKYRAIKIPFKAIKVVLLFLLAFSLNNAHAQSDVWDVIMLKDAQVVRGTITDSIPGTSVTILAGDSLSRTIARADIQLITTEPRRSYYTQAKNKTKDGNKPPPFAYYQGVLGGGFGPGRDDTEYIRLNFINGFGFGQTGSVGLGTGLRMPLNREVAVVPLFVDVRFRCLATKVAPMLAFGLGGCFQPSREWENTGGIFSVEVGISIKKTGKSSLMLTVGYESFVIINGPDTPGMIGFGFYNYKPPVVHSEEIQSVTFNFALGF